MMPFIVEVSKQLNQALKDKIKSSGGYADMESKDLISRVTNDVIASCAFGLKINSHTEENNEFYVKSREASHFTFWEQLKFSGFCAFPTLMNVLGLSLFKKSTKDYFRALVQNMMRLRTKENIIRHDMIHLLMELKKGNLTHDCENKEKDTVFSILEGTDIGLKKENKSWSDDDLTAQAVLFIVAGFDTLSRALSSVFFELAFNPDIQNRLAAEVLENEIKNGGKFDFDCLQKMTYLDMVISESLRKWPSVYTLERRCVKDYNLGKANSGSTDDYIIRKGEGVWIPSWAFQRDARYFPDPEKFDPERFSEDNILKVNPFTYTPFGLGPRMCTGSRFSLCVMKVIVYQLLKELEISVNEKTCIPAKTATDTIKIRSLRNSWLRYTLRK